MRRVALTSLAVLALTSMFIPMDVMYRPDPGPCVAISIVVVAVVVIVAVILIRVRKKRAE